MPPERSLPAKNIGSHYGCPVASRDEVVVVRSKKGVMKISSLGNLPTDPIVGQQQSCCCDVAKRPLNPLKSEKRIVYGGGSTYV
jgi:hypothetical protein